MTMHTRVSGVWKEITEVHTRVSGSWKEITEGWVNVSGVWKQFYSAAPTFGTLTPDTWAHVVTDPANANARMDVSATSIDELNATMATQTWLTQGDRTKCEVQVSISSGAMDGGSATGSWIDLASEANPWWSVTQLIVGTDSCSFTIEFREKADTGNTTGAVAFTLGATVNP